MVGLISEQRFPKPRVAGSIPAGGTERNRGGSEHAVGAAGVFGYPGCCASALHRRTPSVAFDARPKAAPSGAGLLIPGHIRVRQDKIDPSGVITLRYNSRLHHIGLGRRHAGTRVLVLVADLDVRVLTHEGELLREFTLDPRRDYQPQPRP